MAETYCDSDDVKLKAGAGVSGDITAGNFTSLINQAENMINAVMRINLIDGYAALDEDVKLILEDTASSYAATSAIAYNLLGYNSTAEATMLINLNWAKYNEGIKLLKDKFTSNFIQDPDTT